MASGVPIRSLRMPTVWGPAPRPIIVRIKIKTAEAVARMAGGARSCTIEPAGPIHIVPKIFAGKKLNNARVVLSSTKAAMIKGVEHSAPTRLI